MSALRVDLHPGWQSRPAAGVAIAVAGAVLAAAAAATLGAWPGLVVALAVAFAAATRTQWAILDGPVLHVRDAQSAYAFRGIAARRIARVRYRRVPLPWCRLRVEQGPGGDCLVLSAPSPAHASLRPVTMWLIVHGRRRAWIDPRLLDGLASVAEHGEARQPHDASPA